MSFNIHGLAAGFTVIGGTDNGNGVYSFTAAQIGSAAIVAPKDWSGDTTYVITAVSTEREGDSTATSVTGNIHVNPLADAPIISSVINSGFEHSPLTLNLGVALKDTDGSESISAVTISGLATGFSLTGATNNGNGTWSVDPAHMDTVKLVSPTNWSGDTSFTLSATSKEGTSGPTSTTTSTVSAHIEAVADAPTLSVHDATGVANHAIGLNVASALTDTDGSEHLSVVISNVPDHFLFNTGLNNGNGTWSFTQSDLSNLSVTPDSAFSGDAHLHVAAISQENSNHAIATTGADFTVHVSPDT